MEKYIIEFKFQSNFNAGSKARDDVNYFLNTMKFKLVQIDQVSGKIKKLFQLLKLKKSLNIIKDESVVLIQYPYYKKSWYLKSILQNLKRKKVKTICLIHDLNSLRLDSEAKLVSKEISILNKFDVIIAHNQFMTNWLYSKGVKKPIVNLELFDYRTEDFPIDSKLFDKSSVAIAGNLKEEKSGFIYKFNNQNLKDITLNLYGDGFKSDQNIDSINYFGPKPPDKLPSELKGGFGLIWDGPELNSCVGQYGDYMRFNNPHKLSLYIASGLPVIVWKEAAVSEFVIKNGIGIAVDSIDKLSSIIKKVDQQEYKIMQSNIRKIRNNINEGYYLINAVNKCFETLQNEV